ncbi:MAG: hypothetical protein QOJ63_1440 [Solirubrobacteraceae bacterium]|jgi:hypothetical protein|nr:hypothetical protein [Solirubrobacteraceae bacterium]
MTEDNSLAQRPGSGVRRVPGEASDATPSSSRQEIGSWAAFAQAWPARAATGAQLLTRYGIAYLGTIRKNGSPRICPITPILADGRVYAAIAAATPKCADLRRDGRYALHALPGQEREEELCLGGVAHELIDGWTSERAQALVEGHGVIWSAGDALFELQIQRVLWAEYDRDGSGALLTRRDSWSSEVLLPESQRR